MAQEEIQRQELVFERVKLSITGLTEEVSSWSFSKMLEKLQEAILSTGVKSKNKPARYFGRHYLNMTGNERYKEIIGWLNHQPMKEDDILLVLMTLNEISKGTLVVRNEQNVSQELLLENADNKVKSEGYGVVRKLIDHTITVFNSLVGLIIEAGVGPSDVCDGDRMQISDALTRTCKAFGIKAVFPEPDMARSQPLTRNDLQGFGLGFRQSRRRK